MWVPILSRWLDKGNESAPMPLWRDPEISIVDWLIQFLYACFAPKLPTRIGNSNSFDFTRIETIRRASKWWEKAHDKKFAAWQTTQLQVHPSAHPSNETHRQCTAAAAPCDCISNSALTQSRLTCMGDLRELSRALENRGHE